MEHIKGIVCICIVFALIQACTLLAPQVRTIYVPERDAIMLRQDVKNVDIWAKPAEGDALPGKMTLKEGWM